MPRLDLAWAALAWPGTEHLRVTRSDDGVRADGLIVAVLDGQPLRLHYEIRCDASWACRTLTVASPLEPARTVELRGDGQGHWATGTGAPVSALQGCVDVDIAVTPFTNTLPIRRLGLAAGAGAEIVVVYVDVPTLAVRAQRQRYTCVRRGPEGSRWRYDNVVSAFTAELVVDAEGFVIEYPGLWHRI
jgi:hypothetical protein